MTVREYIGARYVPLFMGLWDIHNAYEPLSVVTYQGSSYTSRQAVPEGIEIDNEIYWALTGNYNAQIEQYRQEVREISQTVADLEVEVNNKFEVLDGEIGVTDTGYYWGDCRRYGVFPNTDTVINQQLIKNCLDNSTNLQMEVFFPAGLYNSELNINQSNVWLRMCEGAEWKGLIHIVAPNENNPDATPIENVNIAGTIAGYDRFGMTKAQDIYVENIHMKDDGLGSSRGIHIYHHTKNFKCNNIVIDDAQNASAILDAALSIDGYVSGRPNGEGQPENFFIGNVIVKNSRVHGAYITGKNINIENLYVDGWGYGSYNGSGLQGSNGVAQSGKLHAVWINRAINCNIGTIKVKQCDTNASHPNADSYVYLDETGWSNDIASECTIGDIEISNLGYENKPNDGVQIGDVDYTSPNTNYNIATISISLSDEAQAQSGKRAGIYTCDYAEVLIDYVFIESAQTRCGARFENNSRVEVNKFVCLKEQQNAIFVTTSAHAVVNSLYVERIGESHADAQGIFANSSIIVYLAEAHIRNAYMNGGNTVNAPAITFYNSSKSSIENADFESYKNVDICLALGEFYTIKNTRMQSNDGVGIRFAGGSLYNVILEGVKIRYKTTGIQNDVNIINRITAIGCTITDCTTPSTLQKPAIFGDICNYGVWEN